MISRMESTASMRLTASISAPMLNVFPDNSMILSL
jgi:hypothetical protein